MTRDWILTITLAITPSSCASTSIVALSVSCQRRGARAFASVSSVNESEFQQRRTISRSTSPAIKVSPAFFFQEAIPPSVIVGLMAGIMNLDRAELAAEVCKAAAEPGDTDKSRLM